MADDVKYTPDQIQAIKILAEKIEKVMNGTRDGQPGNARVMERTLTKGERKGEPVPLAQKMKDVVNFAQDLQKDNSQTAANVEQLERGLKALSDLNNLQKEHARKKQPTGPEIKMRDALQGEIEQSAAALKNAKDPEKAPLINTALKIEKFAESGITPQNHNNPMPQALDKVRVAAEHLQQDPTNKHNIDALKTSIDNVIQISGLFT